MLVNTMGTMLNSIGDSVAPFMVTRVLDGKKWMRKTYLTSNAYEILN